MSKATLTHPTWSQIEKGTTSLCLKVADNFTWRPTIIFGLARGGLVPAVIMSHMLDVKMLPISYSSKKGKGEYKQYDNSLPMFDQTRNILLVDDICDTGYTMREVHDHYVGQGHSVVTAALYYKEGAAITPDHVWQKIPHDADWIEFPWEM